MINTDIQFDVKFGKVMQFKILVSNGITSKYKEENALITIKLIRNPSLRV
ncbi:MAG: hypothetical protein N2560_02465 [Ignavibacteria bacterium]|nr:hypothetical protein [Ignavibacteria bacterium]